MKRSNLITLATIAASSLALTACGGGEDTTSVASDCEPIIDGVETVNEGQLTAYVAEYPPYITGAGSQYSGVDGDLLMRIADELCLEPNFETHSFPSILEGVRNGSADLTAGNWNITPEREEEYDVSHPVYSDQMAILSESGASTAEELQDLSVGSVQGYLWIEDLQSLMGSGNLSLYDTEQAIYQDVGVGRIEAGVLTFGATTHLLESNDDDDLELELLEPDERIFGSDGLDAAVLLHEGNDELLEGVNTVIEEMHSSGEIVELLDEYGLPESAADVDADFAQ